MASSETGSACPACAARVFGACAPGGSCRWAGAGAGTGAARARRRNSARSAPASSRASARPAAIAFETRRLPTSSLRMISGAQPTRAANSSCVRSGPVRRCLSLHAGASHAPSCSRVPERVAAGSAIRPVIVPHRVRYLANQAAHQLWPQRSQLDCWSSHTPMRGRPLPGADQLQVTSSDACAVQG